MCRIETSNSELEQEEAMSEKEKVDVFLCGKIGDEQCPQSNNGLCPTCNEKLEFGYGIMPSYGMGTYRFCLDCGIAYDFKEELE